MTSLQPHGGNSICLPMRTRCGNHPKQMASDASNLITVPITLYNGKAVQNVSIGLIKIFGRSLLNLITYRMLLRTWILMLLSLQILGWLDMFQTRKLLVMWLQLDIHSIMQFWFTRKVGQSAYVSLIIWSVKTICTFRLSHYEKFQLTLVSGERSVRVALIYRLHATKKNSLKAANYFKEFSAFLDCLTTNTDHLFILVNFNINWACQRGMQIPNNWLTFLNLSIPGSMSKKEHTDMITS